MALRSRLLKGDSILEAAAVSDPAHVLPGATGPHVGKLQTALIQLDQAAIKVDSIYGPATAAAVLAYKQKRSIIARARQTSADNIVGVMTMASLDRELLERESTPDGPIVIRPLFPSPSLSLPGDAARCSNLVQGFSTGPSNVVKIRLEPGGVSRQEILNGEGATISLVQFEGTDDDLVKACQLFDPALGGGQDNLTVKVTRDPHLIHVKALAPVNAFLIARGVNANGVRVGNTVAIEVRAKANLAATGLPPTIKDANSKGFISGKNSEANTTGLNSGRPINPVGGGRQINLWGEGETARFEDYAADLEHSFDRRNNVFRPLTSDSQRPPGVPAGSASDICTRGAPIFENSIVEIRRMARPGCRFTYSGAADFKNILKAAFAGATIIDELDDAVVMVLP